MIRRGLGKGTGKRGYYNLVPMDSYVHSLSAKGVKSYLYHKTDFKTLKKILKSNKLKPLTKDPLSMSETPNPYLLFTKYEQPISIVLDKSKIKGLVKVDYNKTNQYNDRMTYPHEQEVYTWDYPSTDVIVKVIMLEKVKDLSEQDFGKSAGGGRVIIGTPSRVVSIKDIKKDKIKYQRDESNLDEWDRGRIRINAKGVKTYQKELLKKGIEIRRLPEDGLRYGTLDLDYEFDTQTQKVLKIIPVIVLFGNRPEQDKITITHELIHIKQMENLLFKPLRQKIKQGISLKDAEEFTDEIKQKFDYDILEEEADMGEYK